MPFRINCDNKGCHKDQEALLDVLTNEVMCSECGKSIKNVTDFTKRQMKQLGQIVRSTTAKQAFATKCDACNKTGQPKIINDKAVCSSCNKELNVSAPFLTILKNAIKSK